MKTQITIEDLALQLVVINNLRELLEQLDQVYDCWCKCRDWNCARKVSFIKKSCELLGIIGQEERFSMLIGDIKKTPSGVYPECLTWEKFFHACCKIKAAS